jgi:uncharacterized protein
VTAHALRVSSPPGLDLSGLEEDGFAVIPGLNSAATCAALRALYDDDRHFRSTVVMARHGYGLGEYRYFRYPLPAAVQSLRESLYSALVPIANRWAERLNQDLRYPYSHAELVARCHAAGQARPTPLLLRYRRGDYNCLHQDVYGSLAFPFQVVNLLSEPGRDFEGGELVLVEQRPRRQSRPSVVPLRAGDAVVIATNHLPRAGKRGDYRATLKHGVSTVTRGERFTLGVIFHDAM